MAKVTVVKTSQFSTRVVDTRRYATARLGEGLLDRACDCQGRTGCKSGAGCGGCKALGGCGDGAARHAEATLRARGPAGRPYASGRWPGTSGLGRIQPIARMLAPRENLERASQLVRADLRDCLVDAALPDEIQQCLNTCIQNANYPDAPLDPMNGSLDPRDGQRFGGDGDSCSRRRALAHDYVATRDGLWQARFQARLMELCDPVAVAEAIGVYSNPDAAPSMVTAWVSAASGYYGEYLLPYPAVGGRDSRGCAPPTRLATAEPGELGWETFRRQAAMGTPSNLGYYNIPRTVPRPTGVCVRRIAPERVPGRTNLRGTGALRSVPRGGSAWDFLDVLSVPRPHRLALGPWRQRWGFTGPPYDSPISTRSWSTWADSCTPAPGRSTRITLDFTFAPPITVTAQLEITVAYVMAGSSFRDPTFVTITSETMRLSPGQTSLHYQITIPPQSEEVSRIVVDVVGSDTMGRPLGSSADHGTVSLVAEAR